MESGSPTGPMKHETGRLLKEAERESDRREKEEGDSKRFKKKRRTIIMLLVSAAEVKEDK